jgi:tRNA-2-methylthio-N6-dimethylallyladenosine synthase
VAQLEGTSILEEFKHVDVLVGTHNLHRVPELLDRARITGETAVDLDRKADAFSIPFGLVAHQSRVSAYVTVMEGCDRVCSFCVVPRTRGPAVSRPAGEIRREVDDLVARGYQEILLLGQTVNAYRHDGLDFADLLALVDRTPGLRRLRFTTSHPAHVDARMADALRDLPRVCPYVHLPAQSGSDRVLASMRRGYDRRQYLDTIRLLRDRVPELALSTDVIVGYPGETDSEFQDTLSLLEGVSFDTLFAFVYSARPGTGGGRLPDDVPMEEKRRRLRAVNEQQQTWQRRLHLSHVGRQEEVLVDSMEGEGRVSGRTPHHRIVHLDGGPELVGRVCDVLITGAGPNALLGRLAQPIH